MATADNAEHEGEAPSRVVLKRQRSRHGETKDIALTFNRKAPTVHTGRAQSASTAGRQRQAPGGSPRNVGQSSTGSRRRGCGLSVDKKPTARRKTSKRDSRLRFEMLNAFVDTGMADLSRAELAVWLILYRDTKRDGTARASLDDLARRGGIESTNGKPSGRPTGSPEDASGLSTAGD